MKKKKDSKKCTKVKIPIYFDKVKDAPALAVLEHFRVLSQTDLPMSKFIKFLAVEYCLTIERAERAKFEEEMAANKEKEEINEDNGQV